MIVMCYNISSVGINVLNVHLVQSSEGVPRNQLFRDLKQYTITDSEHTVTHAHHMCVTCVSNVYHMHITCISHAYVYMCTNTHH